MPDEPAKALFWIVPTLLTHLAQAKMCTVKLSGMKLQESLRTFSARVYNK